MSGGGQRQRIFRSTEDRELFLETLGQAREKTGWRVHAWCLMNTHFHLVVETPQPNLVAGMKWLLGTYTIRFNRRHGEFGHLFAGRYKSLIVDGSGDGYLKRGLASRSNPTFGAAMGSGKVTGNFACPCDSFSL